MAALPSVHTYHLHIDLMDSDPPIWRQVMVRSDLPLADLHRVLAAAMGWSGEADYCVKGQGAVLADGAVRDLASLLAQPGDSLLYTYAPAQGWLHKVTLETVTLETVTLETEAPGTPELAGSADSPTPHGAVAHCTAGEGQCPPEFCTGVWDYVDLLDRLSDGDDPDEVDALWQRVGYDFDPGYFDLAAANRRLQTVGGIALADPARG